MQKYAVIDIGSNSVRLMFVADGKVLYKTLNTTRLGEGLAHSTCLTEEAIERTARAVQAYVQQAKTEGAEEVYAFATAAVRSSINGQDFISRVQTLCGMNVEVLSGETEAEIGVLGALGDQNGAVIDVGGASTEIVVKENGAYTYKRSVDIGVVRLKDTCGRDKNALERVAQEKLRLFGEVPLAPLTAIGGTATTLACLTLGLHTYDSETITGTIITRANMRKLADTLSGMSVEEIEKMPCMPKGRADVLSGGAIWLAVIMERLGFDMLTVSDRDNLEGYAVKKGLMS